MDGRANMLDVAVLIVFELEHLGLIIQSNVECTGGEEKRRVMVETKFKDNKRLCEGETGILTRCRHKNVLKLEFQPSEIG